IKDQIFKNLEQAKLYCQVMETQRCEFGNVIKNSDPFNDPADYNASNLPAFHITIPINEVFWDPPFPIPSAYVPVIPTSMV
ncbi:18700_t:CDS:2, partial [Acaulospora morrowiae]